MRRILLVIGVGILCLCHNLFAQANHKHDGKYQIKNGNHYNSTVLIRHIEGDIYEFVIEAQKGPPSYNSGSLSGKITITSGSGIFYENQYEPCSLKFSFGSRMLIIDAIEDESGCGFGYGVYVSGNYKKTKNKLSNADLRYFSND
ncbi:MAG: hypothetical protein ACKN9Y_05800 [Bacteroidota bacterium]